MESKNNTVVVGIAGGSGSGKTTLAELIVKNIDDTVLVNLDDYQYWQNPRSLIDGMENFEIPENINWEALTKDLQTLSKGKSIRVKHRDPYTLDIKKFSFKKIYPKKYIIVEGYLLFHHKFIRDALTHLIYLDATEATRVKRRMKFKNSNYINKVLIPMHNKYIEPTKEYATKVLDTDNLTASECLEILRPLFSY